MIITLKNTTASEVASRINQLREERGSMQFSRVLTLIIAVADMIDVERAIEISDATSREHPCRVIVVVEPEEKVGSPLLNAQIRVGGDAGPSDVIILEPRGDAALALDSLVMPLVLSDTPVVAFWPNLPPSNPGKHPLGKIAARRITDSRGATCPVETLINLGRVYVPGDTDLSWSGVTLWRALLTTMLGQFEALPTSIRITGHPTHPSSFLIAAWLRRSTDLPAKLETDPQAETITGVYFDFETGEQVALTRKAGTSIAHLIRTGLEPRKVNLPRRGVQDCLMEELRRLDPDVYYGALVVEELPQLYDRSHA